MNSYNTAGAGSGSRLAIRIARASHSRLPGRLTRDYKADHVAILEIAISGKIAIFDFPDFFS